MDEDNITHEPLAVVMDGLPSHNPDSGTNKSLGIQSVDIDINVMEKKNNAEQNDGTNVVQYSETVQCELIYSDAYSVHCDTYTCTCTQATTSIVIHTCTQAHIYSGTYMYISTHL